MKTEQSAARFGKARHVHHRSRSARLQARKAIHEYLDPESDAGYIQVERSIPIRRRSDFLQGLDVCDGGTEGSGAGNPGTAGKSGPQLELTFHGDEAEIDRPYLTAAASPLAQRLSISTPSIVADRETNPESNGHVTVDDAFTVGGFVYGCALGSAAAAAILLVVQLTVL